MEQIWSQKEKLKLEASHANEFDTIRVGWKFEELVTGCSQVYIWPRKETAPTSESKMCLPLDAL